MKKLLTYSAVLATAISVIGCGGGSDSGNAKPSDTKSTIKVKNSSQFDYVTATIVTDTGSVIYDKKIDCIAGAEECYLYSANPLTDESVNILFKDGAGRLIRYTYLGALREFVTINPESWDTGLYLTKQLINQNYNIVQFDWLDTNLRLGMFFSDYDSQDGKIDDYEELGEYYALKLKESPGLTESDFIRDFSARLANWDVAKQSELPSLKVAAASIYSKIYALAKTTVLNSSFEFVTPAYAAVEAIPPTCSPMVTNFLSVSGALGKYLPVVGSSVGGAVDAAKGACAKGDEKTKWRLLFTQLEDIATSLNNIGKEVAEVKKFVSTQAINSKLDQFMDLSGYQKRSTNNDNIAQIISDYDAFLSTTKSASVFDYVKSKGSLSAALNDDVVNKALTELLNLPVQSRNGKSILDKISDAALKENDTFAEALVLKCGTLPSSNPDNFILTRQHCNNIILSSSANLVAAQSALIPILKDIYSVLDAYTTNTLTYNKPSYVTSYKTAVEQIVTQFGIQNESLITSFKNKIRPGSDDPGLFDVYEGINTKLLAKMKSVECTFAASDKIKGSRIGTPAIIGWYAPSANSNHNYLVTECQAADYLGKRRLAKARYYYHNQGSVADENDVSNVLGVLVASAYTDTYYMYDNSKWSQTYEFTTTGISLTPDDPNVTIVGGNGSNDRYLGKTPIVVTAGRSANSSEDGVWGDMWDGTFGFNHIRFFSSNANTWNYNWISFQDKLGFNYVVYLWAAGRSKLRPDYLQRYGAGMSCVTYDCSVPKADGYTKIKFRDMNVSIDLTNNPKN